MGELRRIACTDGGGSRGIVAAAIWREIEREAHGRLHSHVDLFAGTSVGAIVSCALAAGLSADEILGHLFRLAPAVFGGGLAKWLRQRIRFGLSAPAHDDQALEKALRDVFGDIRFGELKPRCLVAAYDVLMGSMRVFRNNREPEAEKPIWEIAKASCSAPSYFGAHVMELGRETTVLMDGGAGANNPTALAIQYALACDTPPLQTYCISVGTGRAPIPITPDQAREWGAIEWVPRIFDHLIAASSSAMHKISEGLLPPGHLYRLQVSLRPHQMQLDAFRSHDLYDLLESATNAARGSLRGAVRAAARALV